MSAEKLDELKGLLIALSESLFRNAMEKHWTDHERRLRDRIANLITGEKYSPEEVMELKTIVLMLHFEGAPHVGEDYVKMITRLQEKDQ